MHDLIYEASDPPLGVTFEVAGGHYSGEVHPGSLFLQTDISAPPTVRWSAARVDTLHTMLMLDFDGNARGSWPDVVPEGTNSPVRHWIVGNISGTLLGGSGYSESVVPGGPDQPTVVQPYRPPHIPVISDRYALYLFPQTEQLEFSRIDGPVTNFDHVAFLRKYQLGAPVASNWFVAVYTSESPFSGKPFHGNDVSAVWHRSPGPGALRPVSPHSFS
jgi:hypothetical protein